MPRKPEQYTAEELAEELRSYGDMPVRVDAYDRNDDLAGRAYEIRLELGVDEDGRRYIAVTGYEE